LNARGDRGGFVDMKTVDAHFDEKQILLDEPVTLAANTKLKVLVAEAGKPLAGDELSQWLFCLPEPACAKVWDNARDAK
jgi:hypothetical protein